MMLGINEQIGGTKLVDAKRLLELVWDEGCRPSLRWLRTQTYRRIIPSHRIGRLVFYDPDEVRQALLKISYSTRRLDPITLRKSKQRRRGQTAEGAANSAKY